MQKEPIYKSVPTFRNYEDYCDAVEYTRGWNDAMDYIFPESKKAREKESIKKNLKITKTITKCRRKAPCFSYGDIRRPLSC